MQRDRHKPLDPTADAAMLLRRIGFATLALVFPLAAMVSRRAAVVLVPIGVALMLLAAFIENPNQLFRNLRQAVLGTAGIGLVCLGGWILLSLTWTVNSAHAGEKALNIIMAIILGIVGVAAMPERMRAANLNLVALGTGVASIFALCLIGVHLANPKLLPGFFGESGSLLRGIGVLVIVVWPALAWLLSRDRLVSALVLATIVALVALTRPAEGGIVAVVSGTLAFGLVTANRTLGIRLIAFAVGGLLLLAPALPFVLGPFSAILTNSGMDPMAASLQIWAEIVRSEPIKLITGHGLDTAMNGRMSGTLPAAAPVSFLFETWYELGLVGAAAGALSLWFAINGASYMQGPLAAGGVAAYVTTFALTALGFATLQSWWLMTMVAVAMLFTAIIRGQYRTERPKAPRIG